MSNSNAYLPYGGTSPQIKERRIKENLDTQDREAKKSREALEAYGKELKRKNQMDGQRAFQEMQIAEEQNAILAEQNAILEGQARDQRRMQAQQIELQRAQTEAMEDRAREAERQTRFVADDITSRQNERQNILDSQDRVFKLSQCEQRILSIMKGLDERTEEEAPANDVDEITSYIKDLSGIDSRLLPDVQYKAMLTNLWSRFKEAETQKVKLYIGRRKQASVVGCLFDLNRRKDDVLKSMEGLSNDDGYDAKTGISKVAECIRSLSSIDPKRLPDAECESVFANLKTKLKEGYTLKVRQKVARALLGERYSPLESLTMDEIENIKAYLKELAELTSVRSKVQ